MNTSVPAAQAKAKEACDAPGHRVLAMDSSVLQGRNSNPTKARGLFSETLALVLLLQTSLDALHLKD